MLCVETGADLSALQNCLKVSEEMIASGDSSRYSDMNQSFHYEIWNASGNEKLVTMLSELWNGLSMGVQMTEMEYAKKSFAEHKEIYEAIEIGFTGKKIRIETKEGQIPLKKY